MKLRQFDLPQPETLAPTLETSASISEEKQSRSLSQILHSNLADLLARNHELLTTELLGRIYAIPAQVFESLIIDVLLKMGYAGRRRDLTSRLGKSHDGGIDGVIALDELGLDAIYLQAKRLKPGSSVPISDVRDFVGSLESHKASKGIFVTTGHFSGAAASFCASLSRRVILIDGKQLTGLMIRHNLGVGVVESYQIKQIDAQYFKNLLESPEAARRT